MDIGPKAGAAGMRRIVITILLLASVCFGDVFTSHLKPNTDSALDMGTSALLWRYIYSDSFSDGTAFWHENDLAGFDSISGTILSDGIFTVVGGNFSNVGSISGADLDLSLGTGDISGSDIDLSLGTGSITGTDLDLNLGTGNITGSDIDITAGTGDYNSSGTIGAGVITGTSFITSSDIGVLGATDLLQLVIDSVTINGDMNILGEVVITAQVVGDTPLTLNAIADQTAKVFEIKDSDGNVVFSVDRLGVVRAKRLLYGGVE